VSPAPLCRLRGALALAGTALLVSAAAPAGAATTGPRSGGTAAAHIGPVASSPVAIILLDTNLEDSRASARIAAERIVALRYVAALPAGVRVGLITFSNRWRVLAAPAGAMGRGAPGSAARLAAALAAVRGGGSSSAGLDGAIRSAVSLANRLGAPLRSRLLVLSNGEGIEGTIRVPAIPADVVAWRHEADDNVRALRALARASDGRTASPRHAARLAAGFGPGKVVPSAATTPTPARTTAPAAARPAAAHARVAVRTHWPLAVLVMVAIVFASLFGAGLLLTGTLRRGRRARLLADQIASHVAHNPASEDGTAARSATGWVSRRLSGETEQRLALRLDLAGISRPPAEWIMLGGCAWLMLAALLDVLTGKAVVGVLAGALASWLGMRLIVNIRIGRRRAAFAEQLPELLQLVAGSLRAGFSLAQALDVAVREGSEPAASEFARALSETRIGVELPTALSHVADRMASVDLEWTVMAISIQREIGGNLAEVLLTTAGTMRDRAQLRRHVKALSAEGRLSAYILIALPVLVGGWMFITSPSYMRPLYTTALGLAMVATAVVLMVVGALWMRKVIRVEM
jgi:Flp pilus assembly protein TadB